MPALQSLDTIRRSLNAFAPSIGGNFANAMQKAYPPTIYAELQTDVTATTTTFAAMTDLIHRVEAGRTYNYELCLFTLGVAAAGNKVDFNGGTCSVHAIEGLAIITTASAIATVRQTALNTSLGSSTVNTLVLVKGRMRVNAPGLLVPQHAQNAASGTTTVYIGSYFALTDVTA